MAQKLLMLVLGGLFLFPLVSVVYAQGGDPIATAQAADQAAIDAQWQANRSASQARSARATSQAAYQLATVQANRATATAQWIATATPAAATQQAQATSQALRIKITQQAIDAKATTAALDHQVSATAQAQALQATATQQANWAQLDELDLQRARMANRIYAIGIPLFAGALLVVVGVLVVKAARIGAGHQVGDDFIDAEFYPASDNGVAAPPRLLLTARIERPAFLRPISKEESQRPAFEGGRKEQKVQV